MIRYVEKGQIFQGDFAFKHASLRERERERERERDSLKCLATHKMDVWRPSQKLHNTDEYIDRTSLYCWIN